MNHSKVTLIRSSGNLSLHREESHPHSFLSSIGEITEYKDVFYYVRDMSVRWEGSYYHIDGSYHGEIQYQVVTGPIHDPVFCWRKALKIKRDQERIRKSNVEEWQKTLDSISRACVKCIHGVRIPFTQDGAIECRRFPQSVVKKSLDSCSEYQIKKSG